MSKSRPPYPAEFRRKLIALVRAGRSPDELAKQFEPSAQTIRNWLAQADRDEGKRADGVSSAEREELFAETVFRREFAAARETERRHKNNDWPVVTGAASAEERLASRTIEPNT